MPSPSLRSLITHCSLIFQWWETNEGWWSFRCWGHEISTNICQCNPIFIIWDQPYSTYYHSFLNTSFRKESFFLEDMHFSGSKLKLSPLVILLLALEGCLLSTNENKAFIPELQHSPSQIYLHQPLWAGSQETAPKLVCPLLMSWSVEKAG